MSKKLYRKKYVKEWNAKTIVKINGVLSTKLLKSQFTVEKTILITWDFLEKADRNIAMQLKFIYRRVAKVIKL